MIVHYDGKDYEFDLDDIGIDEATTIYRKCKLTLIGLEQGMTDLNPDALRAIYWYMLKRNGVSADLDRLNFKPVRLASAIGDAVAAKLKADAEHAGQEAPKEAE